MSRKLISRNPDLTRLWDEGYDIELRGPFLLVKSVPYVTAERKVQLGTLVDSFADVTSQPGNHQAWFAGGFPCHEDGTPIGALGAPGARQELHQGLFVDHYFSNKFSDGRTDSNYYDKVLRYITLVCGPAMAIDPTATPRAGLFREPAEEDQVFHYLDTASGTDGVAAVNHKLGVDKVAIVGLGGTGSYVLDLVAKTPVKEIHLFDGDQFHQHNAFRSPGAASREELQERPSKVAYYCRVYGKMRKGLVPHDDFLATADETLQNMNFAFLCLDRGYAKRAIVDKLLEWRIPFIDVGMGVDLLDGTLAGILTVTTVTPEKRDHISRIAFTNADPNNDYSRSIQIADLCALNAALAVMKWKKIRQFYRDLGREHFSAYTIDVNMLTNDEVL
jgi:hypothetical protein